jgi:CRISPR-associated protein Cmr6
MTQPLYRDVQTPRPDPRHGHGGLWFERFFDAYDDNWALKQGERSDGKDRRGEWLQRLVNGGAGRAGNEAVLRDRALRRCELTEALGGQWRLFNTDFRFLTGLGYPHPVENGLAWHPTLGVPYLAGAAVKGMVRAFCEVWHGWDSGDERLQRWFGVGSGEKGRQESAGALIFFEAFPVTPPTLSVDIMTPHMGAWYLEGDRIEAPWQATDADKVPGDWHDPTPISFLAVERATFQFAIAPRPGAGDAEVEPALDVLEEALAWIGAGAKTAVGYGRMDRDEGGEQTLIQQREAAEQARREAEKAAQRESLPPEERALFDLEQMLAEEREAGRDQPNQSPLPQKIQQLLKEADDWPAEHRRRLADLIEAVYRDFLGWSSKAKKNVKPELSRLRGEA